MTVTSSTTSSISLVYCAITLHHLLFIPLDYCSCGPVACLTVGGSGPVVYASVIGGSPENVKTVKLLAGNAPAALRSGKRAVAMTHQAALIVDAMSDGTKDTHVSTLSSSTKLHVATGTAVAVIGATLALTAPFVLLKTPLPYMATPGHKIKRALQSLHPKTKKGTFVDLGSGDGEAVYQAYRAGFERVVGYELNWTLWGVSQMRRLLFWGPQARRTTRIYCKDLFASALPSDTMAVMVFGVTPLMKPISVKLAKETRPGVHVLSYRFPIPLHDSDSETTQNLLRAKLIYDYEEMRVYKVIDEQEEERNESVLSANHRDFVVTTTSWSFIR